MFSNSVREYQSGMEASFRVSQLGLGRCSTIGPGSLVLTSILSWKPPAAFVILQQFLKLASAPCAAVAIADRAAMVL